jgi:type IV secretion system protein VirB10
MTDTPTPPENPFESPTAGIEGPALDHGATETMSEGTPDVAARNGKAFLVLGVVGAVVLFLLYNIFFGGEKDNIDKKPKQLVVAPKSFEPPPLPEAPAEPVIPPPSIVPPSIPEPMSIPDIKNVNPLNPEEDSARKAQELARLRSAMLIQDGAKGGVGSIFGGNTTTPTPPADPNSQFAASLANTKAERVEATSIGDMRRTIAQGRLIQATMESALNTDLPAPIRAIVSRDTYGEAGTKPLIPKGSRLIGSYNTAVSSGQTRVFVVWTRVIRPDGVDIMLGSPLVDGIGQAGIGGQVDSKFQEIFARSLLSSVMNIAVAIGSDKINGGNSTTTTTTTGSQTSGDGATTATTNALNRLGSVTDGFIQKFLSVAPTILVDQGTPVNVFVNKDLVFPEEAVGARIVN